jgi:hypothetical protein
MAGFDQRLDLVNGPALADRDQADVVRLASRDGTSPGNAGTNFS